MSDVSVDPLLVLDDKRFVMFPIKDENIFSMYKKQIDCFWRTEEIDLTKDLEHWNRLNKDEQFFISMILAFFCWYSFQLLRIEPLFSLYLKPLTVPDPWG